MISLLRGDKINIEPSIESMCEIAMSDKEINRLSCGSLEYCVALFKRYPDIREKCVKTYNWAQGSKRGD